MCLGEATHLPKAPYVLTIRNESKDVFMAWFEDNKFLTTGILRYAISNAIIISYTFRTAFPVKKGKHDP